MVRDVLREKFLQCLEAADGRSGNSRLRETLGWQEDTYWKVQAALIEEGAILSGRGRGGSVSLVTASEQVSPKQAAKAVNTPRALRSQQESAKVKNAKMKKVTNDAAGRAETEAMKLTAARRSGGVVKKSTLYSSLWASCDELRGGMDASQYKDYVLFMLFIKYVSDKYGDQR